MLVNQENQQGNQIKQRKKIKVKMQIITGRRKPEGESVVEAEEEEEDVHMHKLPEILYLNLLF